MTRPISIISTNSRTELIRYRLNAARSPGGRRSSSGYIVIVAMSASGRRIRHVELGHHRRVAEAAVLQAAHHVLAGHGEGGTEVTFQGAQDPHTPIAQGWLRA